MTEPAAAGVETTTIATVAPEASAAAPVTEVAAPADGAAIEGAAVSASAPEPTKLERARAAADRIKNRTAARRRSETLLGGAVARGRELETQLAAERARADRAEAAARAIESDPLGELRKRGVTQDVLARAAVEDNSPEAIARRAQEDAAAARREVEALRTGQTQTAQQQAREAARGAFLTEARGAGMNFPLVAAHASVRGLSVVREAEEVIATHGDAFARVHGRRPSNREVLEYLEFQYAQADKARAAPGPGAAAAAKPAAGGSAATTGAGTKTLTGRTAERATVPRTFDEMSPTEQLHAMAAQLRATAR